ncbi:DUF6152 family protein [Vulcaniibacterium tengchongense]|uniref:Uncharacterized protein n=1 Tax=Vulcaniibacterium tengchongense TaxID=1273429 RepID=A0A3N4VJG8_9GAMM|nr:DUF6152 family protein [Vulcaniibacterium tengchongense]RPE77187.1 hypothetical protein EDC50_2452 [Vulcaniibacterium tengchongense]
MNRVFRFLPALPALLASLLFASAALAHHGWGSYDADKTMTFDAKLAEVRWGDPHAEAEVDHQGRRWTVVLAPTSRMQARGLPEGALAVGKTLTIVGYPRRDGSAELRAERVIVDGKTVELR